MTKIKAMFTFLVVSLSIGAMGAAVPAHAHLELEECSGTLRLDQGDKATKHGQPSQDFTWESNDRNKHYCKVNCMSGEGQMEHVSGNGHAHPHAVVYKCVPNPRCAGIVTLIDGQEVWDLDDGTFKLKNYSWIYCNAKCDLGRLTNKNETTGVRLRKCKIERDEEYQCKGAAVLYDGEQAKKLGDRNWVYVDHPDTETVFCAARCRYGNKKHIGDSIYECRKR